MKTWLPIVGILFALCCAGALGYSMYQQTRIEGNPLGFYADPPDAGSPDSQ